MNIPPQKCRAPECPVDVYLLRHRTTGNFAPIEVLPSAGGNVLVDMSSGTYIILTKESLALARERGHQLRLNHWANQDCPIVIARNQAKAKGAATA